MKTHVYNINYSEKHLVRIKIYNPENPELKCILFNSLSLKYLLTLFKAKSWHTSNRCSSMPHEVI